MARYPQIEQALANARRSIRLRGYSRKTEDTYLRVIRGFLHFNRRVPPESLGGSHFRKYMVHLAEARRLAAGTRNQAASAIAFFYRDVLGSDVGEHIPRARYSASVPVVLSHDEAIRVLAFLSGKYRLIGSLLYGTGTRLGECLRLRVKDLDFDLAQITVRDGKGGKDRFTILPVQIRAPLRRQIELVDALHRTDREKGAGWAPLPHALARKDPGAGFSLGWKFLFPGSRLTLDPAVGRQGRRHLHHTAVQRNVKKAIQRAGITKAATTHTFRHSFATQLLRDGYDIRTVQKLLGHHDVRVTMQYLHAVEHTGINVRSPLDRS
jgi:integron integrase